MTNIQAHFKWQYSLICMSYVLLFFSTCDEIQRILGFDWLLLFVQGHLHLITVVTAMRILLLMLGSPSALQKFRDGSSSKGWLDDTHLVLNNRIGAVLGKIGAVLGKIGAVLGKIGAVLGKIGTVLGKIGMKLARRATGCTSELKEQL